MMHQQWHWPTANVISVLSVSGPIFRIEKCGAFLPEVVLEIMNQCVQSTWRKFHDSSHLPNRTHTPTASYVQRGQTTPPNRTGDEFTAGYCICLPQSTSQPWNAVCAWHYDIALQCLVQYRQQPGSQFEPPWRFPVRPWSLPNGTEMPPFHSFVLSWPPISGHRCVTNY